MNRGPNMKTALAAFVLVLAAGSVQAAGYNPKVIKLDVDKTLVASGGKVLFTPKFADGSSVSVTCDVKVVDGADTAVATGTASSSAPCSWTTSAGGIFTGKAQASDNYPDWVASANVTVVKVKIITQTTDGFEILQQVDVDSQDVEAEVTPSGRALKWSVDGSGKDYVDGKSSSGGTIYTVRLKSLLPSSWVRDSGVYVNVQDSELPDACAFISIDLKKFKRDYQTSPGSDPIKIKMPSGFGAATLETSGTATASVSDRKTSSDDEGICRDKYKSNQSDPFRIDYKYKSEFDYCTAQSSKIENTVYYSGLGNVYGIYDGWFGGGSPRVGACSSAGIQISEGTNADAALGDPWVARAYQGSPAQWCVGLGAGKEGVGGAISVTFTVGGINNLGGHCHPDGSYLVIITGETHQPGAKIEEYAKAFVGVATHVEEESDNEWILDASCELTASTSEASITFVPTR